MAHKYDVIVVGAGPAGSMAAMKAAEGGAKTIILEKYRLPRFKLCGGGIANWLVKHLNIPEEVLERQYKVLSFFTPPNYERHDINLGGLGYFGVYRDALDYQLTKLALEKGAELKENTHVEGVVKEEGCVKGVTTKDREKFEGDVVIACDGALSTIAKKCGMWDMWFKEKGETWKDQMCFCVGVEMRLGEKVITERYADSYMIFTGRDIAPMGYAWIFPKRENVSVGLGSMAKTLEKKPTDYMNRFIKNNPIASKLLEGGEVVLKRGAWIPIRNAYKPSYDSGLLIAGDAAGMVSPITGEGVYYAVRAGMDAGVTAAEAVNSGDFSAEFLSAYQERWVKSVGNILDFQDQIFQNTVGKILALEDEKEKDEQYEKGFVEAFNIFVSVIEKYAQQKKETPKATTTSQKKS
ncbi:MAG: geranylgeranyl reductase family protein [Candidatus Jordarchaeum sp.]|uniref:geranylgeranyl reductase family protein n=1 Tax=Candidatus Jordarchaeum sp. TaxID=2823881 RepID=UPI0040492921